MKSDEPTESHEPDLFSVPPAPEQHPTSGVRIVGATTAGETPATFSEPIVASDSSGIDLQDWTEPPTGQIPAIVRTDHDDDPWASVEGPTWREDKADWEHDARTFDTSLLADDPTTSPPLEPVERTPWEFDVTDTAVGAGAFGASAYEEFAVSDDVTAVLGTEPEVAPIPRTARNQGSRSRSRATRPPKEPRPQKEVRSPEVLDEPIRATRRLNPPQPPEPRTGENRNLKVAVIVGFALVALVLIFAHYGNPIMGALVMVVVTLATLEGFAMFRRSGARPATLLGLLLAILTTWGAYNFGEQAVTAMVVLAVVSTFCWYLFGVEHADVVAGMGATLIAFCWITLLGSYGELLLNPNTFPNRHGIAFLVAAIAMAGLYDVGALFGGQRFGRRPLAPSISPNKTWEGAVGGFAMTIAAGIVISFVAPWSLSSAMELAIVVSIVSPIGDLAESLLKRRLGLKDSGSILPGHGGILDRVDGLLFVLPATYFLVRILNLG